ncbi:MAG TPA: hypothetical protein VMT54_11570 [Candidatus Cybelea sp.]|nr:hypothetical protein [Candidatus Cybelea sp.]
MFLVFGSAEFVLNARSVWWAREVVLVGRLKCRRAFTVSGAVVLGILYGLMQAAQGDDDAALQKQRTTDHWRISPTNRLALVWSLDRKTPLLLLCDRGVVELIVPLEKRSLGEKGHYPVTIVFDHNTTITQTWLGSKGGWATYDAYPDFTSLLAMLQTHQEVEFVLKRPETDPIDSHFSLNGVEAAIDAVVGECRAH